MAAALELIEASRNGKVSNFGLTMRSVIEHEVVINGGYTNAHAHLDRFTTVNPGDLFTNRRVDISLQRKWSVIDELKRQSTVDDIYDRLARGIEYQLAQGVTAIGTFIDIDPVIEDKAIRAAQRIKDQFRGSINMVFINQVLKGVIEPSARYWFNEAVQFVDIIGGLPAKDQGWEEEHLDILLGTAKDMGKIVHVHVDQNGHPRERETELLARKTIQYHMEGRVAAIHSISIAAQEKPYRQALYAFMKQASLAVIACPTAWIDRARNEDLAPIHNSVTPIDEMLPAGLTVALGTDNIEDLYCPLSEGLMWDELKLAANAARHRDMDNIVKMATENGRRVLGLPPAIISR